MHQELIKYEWKKLRLEFFIILAITFLLFLAPSNPLSSDNLWIGLAAILLGWVLSWKLFTDTDGTQAFLFSRGLSNSRIFWYRWLMGITLLLGTALAILIVLCTGIRSMMYQNLSFYPLLRWYDLHSVLPYVYLLLISFCIHTFLLVQSYLANGTGDLKRFSSAFHMVISFIVVAISYLIFNMASTRMDSANVSWPFSVILSGLAALAILCTVAAWHGYQNMEITA